MALRLADAFGTEPGVWLDLQQQYDLWHASKRNRPKVEVLLGLREPSQASNPGANGRPTISCGGALTKPGQQAYCNPNRALRDAAYVPRHYPFDDLVSSRFDTPLSSVSTKFETTANTPRSTLIEWRTISRKKERRKEGDMPLEVCLNCGKKQFNASSRKCYACKAEQRKDGTLVDVPAGYILDENGNIRSFTKYETEEGKLHVRYHYVLEPGKTTLRGEYPKLAAPPICVHPERLSCNHGDGFGRCEYMLYVSTQWACKADSI